MNNQFEEVEDGWTQVVSKKSLKKEKFEQERQRIERKRAERDVRYLLTHSDFQSHRLKRNDIIKIIKEKASSNGSIYIIGHGRCVGHVIDYNKVKQKCLQCNWTSDDFKDYHCCCFQETVDALPPNFYLGCNGPVNMYLQMMREKPLE